MGNIHHLNLVNREGAAKAKTKERTGLNTPKKRVPHKEGQKEGQENKKNAPSSLFETLDARLRQRLLKAEQDVDSVLLALERDLVATRAADTPEATLQTLTQTIRHRFKEQLAQVSAQTQFPALEREGALFAQKLATELSQLLSLDVYRDIVARLAEADCADDYDEFGLDRALISRIKPIFDFFYYRYWRVSVRGIENIPTTGPVLLVANHSGTLPYDGAMIKAAILNEHPARNDARFLVEDFVYHFPFLGTLMYRIGGVRASPENAERLLNKGHAVIVFPEGVKGIGKLFKDRYRLQRFGRGGFVRLALRTGTPIVPVAVIGAEEIHPLLYRSRILAKPLGIPYVPFTPTLPALGLLGLAPLPSKWTIEFGKPIDVRDVEVDRKHEDLFIHQTSESVRTTIQTMIDQGLASRKSVWFG